MNEDEKTNGDTVNHVLDHIQKLPSLPSMVAELLENFNNEKLDVATLANKIARDQAIVARIMRVANSPFFGFSGQIGSISEAISVLGFNNLRGLVMAAFIIDAFPHKESPDFDWVGCWQHGIGTAVCAKVLAKHVGLNPETAFTAGLLHDVGRLVMGVYFPQAFAQVTRASDGSTASTLQAERDALGLDHAVLGGEMAKRWNFPPEIREAVALHHTVTGAGTGTGTGTEKTLTDVVYIANLFAHALDDGHIREAEAAHLTTEIWARLGLDSGKLEAMAEEAQRLYEGAVMLVTG